MTASQPKLAEVREQRQIGTVKVTLVEVAGRSWIAALIDKYGVQTSCGFDRRPGEGCVEKLVEFHVRISAVRTQRN